MEKNFLDVNIPNIQIISIFFLQEVDCYASVKLVTPCSDCAVRRAAWGLTLTLLFYQCHANLEHCSLQVTCELWHVALICVASAVWSPRLYKTVSQVWYLRLETRLWFRTQQEDSLSRAAGCVPRFYNQSVKLCCWQHVYVCNLLIRPEGLWQCSVCGCPPLIKCSMNFMVR